jgi:DNA replication protein
LTTKESFTSKYACDLYSEGTVVIPYSLLSNYTKLNISDGELTLIIQLFAYKQINHNFYPSPEELANIMANDSFNIKAYIASLIEKNILDIDQKIDINTNKLVYSFNFYKLFDKLADLWAKEKQETLLEQNKLEQLNDHFENDEILGEMYRTFEKEFGRPLTPVEISQISEWCHQDNYSPELIYEALKRSVLRGVTNFKYIDSILSDWNKNNIKTINEATAYEERFKNRGKQVDKKKSKNDSHKYKDVYI